MLRAMGHSKDTIFTNDKRIKYLPTYMTSNWKESENYNTPYIELSGIQFEFQKSLIGKMQHAGVKIIAGTDFPNPYCFPGFSLHDELSLMVEGGMTPLEALKSATLNPALFLNKKKEYGTVAAGKFASLILLNKNPLENINNTKEIYAVFLKGNYFDRTSLDKLLKNAALAAVNQ
jgi:imidazolonepropionase-like amidohydrolase